MTELLTPSGLGKTRGGGRGGQRAVPIPLSANEWVTLQGDFPLTEAAWDQLLRVLDVMKPGLVVPALSPAEDDKE